MRTVANGHTFEVRMEPIEVTSLSRPDEAWQFTDAAGHVHRFLFNGVAGRYSPSAKAEIPTVERVVDGIQHCEDGEPYEVSHLECRECRDTVVPRYRADDTRQFIAGLRECYVDGEAVSEAEFERLVLEHLGSDRST